jgi:hypothetical protein
MVIDLFPGAASVTSRHCTARVFRGGRPGAGRPIFRAGARQPTFRAVCGRSKASQEDRAAALRRAITALAARPVVAIECRRLPGPGRGPPEIDRKTATGKPNSRLGVVRTDVRSKSQRNQPLLYISNILTGIYRYIVLRVRVFSVEAEYMGKGGSIFHLYRVIAGNVS